jgi:hypothetical protein
LTPAAGNVADVEANVATGQGAGATGDPAWAAEDSDGPGGAPSGLPPASGGLAPLPYDGVGSVAVGTVLWLIALIVMIPLAGRLRHDGHLWWLATAACGFGLGLVGLFIVVRRRDRIRRGERSSAN